MKKQQGDFTRIEVVMVLVVLGILAACALPRFAKFSGDARLAAMQGAAGAVKSASAIVHAAALADPKTASNGTISVEVDVALVGTYAAPTEEGIALAAQLSTDDFDIDDSTTPNTITVADKTKSACLFSYKMASGDSAPTITTTALNETNCN